MQGAVGTAITVPTRNVGTKLQYDPDVAIDDSTGNFAVSWTVRDQALTAQTDVRTRAFFADGSPQGADADVADHGFCPHCRNQDGLLVRGQSKYSATHAGRRYLFPDPEHLEAFRASPEKYLR